MIAESLMMLMSLAAGETVSAAGANAPRPWEKHGLEYDAPAATWDEAMPLGNGTLGALVWGEGDTLRLSLDRTDLWDLRPVPEFLSAEYNYATMRQWEREGKYDDLVRVYETPYNRPAPTKIPAGRLELDEPVGGMRLNLKEAQVVLHERGDLKKPLLQTWIHALEPVGFLRVHRNDAPKVRLVPPAFGGGPAGDDTPSIVAGNVSELGYPPPRETKGADWAAYEQEGWGVFQFAVYAAWRQTGEGSWTVAWTVMSGEGPQLERAKEQVTRALGQYAELEEGHQRWWDQYWTQGWVSIPDQAIERQYYLDMYKFGAAARRDAPPITLQGPWTADDGKLPPWKGDYHHDLNTELSYWPAYAGNRLEEAEGFVNWLWDTRGNCEAWTKRFYGMDGMNVPMTADLNNQQIGGWRQYTHSATTSAWLAHHFYLHWKYSADPKFLEERAYPYLQAVGTFLEQVTNERDAQGLRTLPLSSSPEINDNRPTAWFPSITNYDCALIRWVFTAGAEMADALGKTEDAAHWRKLLAEMPDLSLGEDGRLLVAAGKPLEDSHRHFSHLMAIHPLGTIDLSQGEEAAKSIRASLEELKRLGTKQWTGYSFAWHASLAARAKDGETAAESLRIFAEAFVLRNSFHCNGDQSGKGYSAMTYRPFTLEGNFAFAAGVHEMLLQSHTGAIEVFPAAPKAWGSVSFTNLRAQGAFLVAARRMEDGEVAYVQVRAERGGEARVRSPWTGEVVARVMAQGEIWKLEAPGTSP